ncbi:MAG: PLP-dependent aminotransferase family protein [Thermomicrobiales bacterium]
MPKILKTTGDYRLARRSRAFEHNPWQAAEDLGGRHPDPIYFGNGAPAAEIQPLERLQWAAERAWVEVGGKLGYGELEGWLPLRELIAERMINRGVRVDVDSIVVTNGSQQGIDLIARLFLDPGDAIIVEGPTYIGAMQVFDAYEARYLTCPVDDHGLCTDELEQMLKTANPTPKLLYTIPTFQNPTGFTAREERRRRLLELTEQYGVIVVEDDPYGEIYFTEDPPASALRAMSDKVIYLGSFSKTIAPALRVGWTIAPADLMPLLLMAKEGADIHSNRIETRIVYYTAMGFLDDHVGEVRAFYRNRRDILASGLDASMTDRVAVFAPDGGFFVWCELPAEAIADDLLISAASYGVAFLPGAWFYPDYSGPGRGMRLSYSSLPEEKIEEGARRLGAAVGDYLQRLT